MRQSIAALPSVLYIVIVCVMNRAKSGEVWVDLDFL